MRIDPSQVNGWGVDADPRNDPAWPMRDSSRDDHGGMNWTRPPQQQRTVEILCSTERPQTTAVFGTSVPPTGLSGTLRRKAFSRSEGQWGHWLLLLLADRVNMVEGFAEDLKRGKVPNVLAEMGMRAELRHNPLGIVKKVAIAAGVLALAGALIRAGAQRRR